MVGRLSHAAHNSSFLKAPPTLKPRGNFESEVVTPQVGSNVLLRCEAQGAPEPEVTWYHNGLQMVPGDRLDIEGHLLHIKGVQVRGLPKLT